jgi:excisionase family DNA binding protein
MDIKTLAEKLNVTQASVVDAIRTGALNAFRVGHKLLTHEDHVKEWLKNIEKKQSARKEKQHEAT